MEEVRVYAGQLTIGDNPVIENCAFSGEREAGIKEGASESGRREQT